jgi:glycosyltransferase involved in cell wall biosynthesis
MISIILPAHNEELQICNSVRKLDAALTAAFPDIEIIVVDDGSADRTADLISNMRTTADLVVIRNAVRCGKGSAIRSGLSVATGNVVAYTDADLPISPASIISAISAVDSNSCDMCVGDRAQPHLPSGGKGSVQRRLASWVYRNYLHLIFPKLPQDPACCLKVFSRDLAELIKSKATVDSYMLDIEVYLIAVYAGAEIREIPVIWDDKRPSLPLRGLLLRGLEGLWGAAMLRSRMDRAAIRAQSLSIAARI